jgi:hypothetical protein
LSFSAYQKKTFSSNNHCEKKDRRWAGLNMNAREGKVCLANLARLLMWQPEPVKAIPRVNTRN